MIRAALAVGVSLLVSACGFTITSTPTNPNLCAIGAVYGCNNADKPFNSPAAEEEKK